MTDKEQVKRIAEELLARFAPPGGYPPVENRFIPLPPPPVCDFCQEPETDCAEAYGGRLICGACRERLG